jgi:hypothetical protein
VESESGRGSRFAFTLPIEDASRTGPANDNRPGKPPVRRVCLTGTV